MEKWQHIQQQSLAYILRNEIRRNFGELVLNKEAAYAHEDDIEAPSYNLANGWHFYAYLAVAPNLQKAEKSPLTERLVGIYNDYTKAAKSATAKAPDAKVALLEHQGVLLHFFLDYDKDEERFVIAFAKELSEFVKDRIFKDKEDGVVGFKMAAEFGRSIIIKVPSASGERAAHSRISLGPSANDPARKLLGGQAPRSWHFAYRTSDDLAPWEDVDCTPPKTAEVRFAMNERAEFRRVVLNTGIEKVPDNPPEHPAIYYGFVFRADMDGFTDRVKSAFANNNQSDIEQLALDFINFMEDVNDWQQSFIPGHKVIVFPWAGDCCNMITYPVGDTDKNDRTLVKQCLSEFPTQLILSWNDYLKNKNRRNWLSGWTYGMASGSIKVFSVFVDNVPYRLMAGWPVGISQEGVNLDGTKPDDLIMHDDDIKEMDDYAKKSFSPFGGYEHYKKQDKNSRQSTIITKVGLSAKETVVNGFSVPKSKPYFPESK